VSQQLPRLGAYKNGSLTGKITAASYSSLCAVTAQEGSGTTTVHLFYQGPSNNIRHWIKAGNNEWTEGDLKEASLAGTDISAHSLEQDTSGRVWLYFQTPDAKIVEFIWSGNKWTKSKCYFHKPTFFCRYSNNLYLV
jgi:hypothetical protein